MKREQWSAIVKGNGGYTCIECGVTEMIQAHDPTKRHIDPKDGQCLCAGHHADKHPDLPRALFFNKMLQPYWNNISAASLARTIGCHSRTVIRRAKRLGLAEKDRLSDEDIVLLKNKIHGQHRVNQGHQGHDEAWMIEKTRVLDEILGPPPPPTPSAMLCDISIYDEDADMFRELSQSVNMPLDQFIHALTNRMRRHGSGKVETEPVSELQLDLKEQ